MMGDATRVHVERRDAVAHVVLSRPELHDAFDDKSGRELREALDEISADSSVRVALIRSTGSSFCAGADLAWMQRLAAASREDNLRDAEAMEAMFRSIATCRVPVVARVQGPAFGGGAGLIAACDIAIASTRARLAFSEVRLGIMPAVISPYVLGKVTPGVARALFLTGETISADRALEVGLLHRVVEPDALDAAVDETVGALLAGSPAAQAGIKRLVTEVSRCKSLADAAPLTTAAIADARSSDDGREGMAAFLAKRKPNWR